MPELFAEETSQAFAEADKIAIKAITTSHLALTLYRKSPTIRYIMATFGINSEDGLRLVLEQVNKGISTIIEKPHTPSVKKVVGVAFEKMREINGKVITPVLLFWAILQIENNRVYRYFLEQLREKTHNLIQELLYAFWLEVGSAQCELEFDDLMKSHHRGWVVYHGTDRVLLTKEEDPGDIPQTLRDKSIDPNECLIASIRIYQAL